MTSGALGRGKKIIKTSYKLSRATEEPVAGQRYQEERMESLVSRPRIGDRKGSTETVGCARLWAGRLPRALPRLVRKRGAPTPHWSPAFHAHASGRLVLRAALRWATVEAHGEKGRTRGSVSYWARRAGSYQRGQLAACPRTSAPAQFNGHCPPAPLFRRRLLPAGPSRGRAAGNQDAEATLA